MDRPGPPLHPRYDPWTAIWEKAEKHGLTAEHQPLLCDVCGVYYSNCPTCRTVGWHNCVEVDRWSHAL